MRRIELISIMMLVSLFVGGGRLSAETKTPMTPDPIECKVSPRSLPGIELLLVIGSGKADPMTPLPEIATASLQESVTATIVESVACINANDALRWLAHFSDGYVVERFGPDHPDDFGHLEVALTRQPMPAPEDERLSIVSIDRAILTPEGRALVVVTTRNAAETFHDRLWLRWESDRWLIDASELVA